MPSYHATASKPGADGKAEFFASHEFEAPDTADAWVTSESVVPPGQTSIRLYAGKMLLCKRVSPAGIWEKANRP